MMGSFVKGTCIGLVAGVSLGLMASPKTRKKIVKAPTRIFHAVENAIDNMMY